MKSRTTASMNVWLNDEQGYDWRSQWNKSSDALGINFGGAEVTFFADSPEQMVDRLSTLIDILAKAREQIAIMPNHVFVIETGEGVTMKVDAEPEIADPEPQQIATDRDGKMHYDDSLDVVGQEA